MISNIIIYTYLLQAIYITIFYVAEYPCSTVTDCSQSCANISGRETCFCMSGYQLDIDDITCSGMIL